MSAMKLSGVGVRTYSKSFKSAKFEMIKQIKERQVEHSYLSNITRKQFKIIKPILESAKKTKPRVIDLYDVFCGVLYIRPLSKLEI